MKLDLLFWLLTALCILGYALIEFCSQRLNKLNIRLASDDDFDITEYKRFRVLYIAFLLVGFVLLIASFFALGNKGYFDAFYALFE